MLKQQNKISDSGVINNCYYVNTRTMVVPARLVTVHKSAVFGLDCPVSLAQAPFSSPPESPCNQTPLFASCQETGEHQSRGEKEM